MNPKNLIVCPNCKSTNTIFIEDLYFALIEKDKQVLAQLKLNADQCKSLVKHLNPPSLERLPIWVIIQPDILFSIVMVVLLLLTISSGISLNLEMFLLPIILILSYILLRNTLNDRFRAKKDERLAEIQRAQKAADYWSTLFICLNDMTVFSGHSNNYFPVEEFQDRIFSETASKPG